jgi:hypothetical protein
MELKTCHTRPTRFRVATQDYRGCSQAVHTVDDIRAYPYLSFRSVSVLVPPINQTCLGPGCDLDLECVQTSISGMLKSGLALQGLLNELEPSRVSRKRALEILREL